jgi:hypothetical protein
LGITALGADVVAGNRFYLYPELDFRRFGIIQPKSDVQIISDLKIRFLQTGKPHTLQREVLYQNILFRLGHPMDVMSGEMNFLAKMGTKLEFASESRSALAGRLEGLLGKHVFCGVDSFDQATIRTFQRGFTVIANITCYNRFVFVSGH